MTSHNENDSSPNKSVSESSSASESAPNHSEGVKNEGVEAVSVARAVKELALASILLIRSVHSIRIGLVVRAVRLVVLVTVVIPLLRSLRRTQPRVRLYLHQWFLGSSMLHWMRLKFLS